MSSDAMKQCLDCTLYATSMLSVFNAPCFLLMLWLFTGSTHPR